MPRAAGDLFSPPKRFSGVETGGVNEQRSEKCRRSSPFSDFYVTQQNLMATSVSKKMDARFNRHFHLPDKLASFA